MHKYVHRKTLRRTALWAFIVTTFLAPGPTFAGIWNFDGDSDPTGELGYGSFGPYDYFGPSADSEHASGNTVTVTGKFKIPEGAVSWWGAIGVAGWGAPGTAEAASNNHLHVRDVERSSYNYYYAAVSEDGDLTGNTLLIENSTVYTQNVVGGRTVKGNVFDNTVRVKDSTLTGAVIGAYISDSGTAEASRNTVVVVNSKITTNMADGVEGA